MGILLTCQTRHRYFKYSFQEKFWQNIETHASFLPKHIFSLNYLACQSANSQIVPSTYMTPEGFLAAKILNFDRVNISRFVCTWRSLLSVCV